MEIGFTGSKVLWLIPIGDTVIGPYKYKKYIDSSRNMSIGFFREDVSSKKVYYWNYGDNILFDFSLKLGDSILLQNFYSFKVIAEDSITVSAGVKRRRLVLQNQFFSTPENWIEGVGTLGFPTWYDNFSPSDPVFYLLCSYQNGIPIYNRSFQPNQSLCNNNCCPSPPVIGNSKQHIYKWFPNPFSVSSTYLSEIELKNVTMQVYSSNGQLVKQEKINSGYTITFNRNFLPSGVYFVKLTQENTILMADKLIIIR